MESELSCQELLTFLARYVAGQLDPGAKAEFERHLARCDECVAYLNDLPAVMRLAQRCVQGEGELLAEVPQELIAAVRASRRHGGG